MYAGEMSPPGAICQVLVYVYFYFNSIKCKIPYIIYIYTLTPNIYTIQIFRVFQKKSNRNLFETFKTAPVYPAFCSSAKPSFWDTGLDLSASCSHVSVSVIAILFRCCQPLLDPAPLLPKTSIRASSCITRSQCPEMFNVWTAV